MAVGSIASSSTSPAAWLISIFLKSKSILQARRREACCRDSDSACLSGMARVRSTKASCGCCPSVISPFLALSAQARGYEDGEGIIYEEIVV